MSLRAIRALEFKIVSKSEMLYKKMIQLRVGKVRLKISQE
jgi:hypothetical protein